ncbi:hypothetical protein PFNF135_01543 [Plasmodium falciparum NF135/5.C10]|uniref:Uncharacterized protein n=1 Tax=Plasmodium falciparum NF135/5.C10 TaxID=1036726 RepID=W4ILN3_PLAFA|nr:hypothetical protein PFNF135_01543 [Plasmodium falciparum NF135/5.C10]
MNNKEFYLIELKHSCIYIYYINIISICFNRDKSFIIISEQLLYLFCFHKKIFLYIILIDFNRKLHNIYIFFSWVIQINNKNITHI